MGHSTSNMSREAEAKVVPKANMCSEEKAQQQPYGQEKTESHNSVFVFRIASENSVSVSLTCLEASVPFPRYGLFYFLLSSLNSQLLAVWLCCPSPLAMGYSPAASLLLTLPCLRSRFFICSCGVNFIYLCVGKSKMKIMIEISFHYLYPVSLLCDVFTLNFTAYRKHVHLIVKTA